MVISLKTAKALRLAVPNSLQLLADEVNSLPFAAPAQVGSWHFASIHSNAALRSLSERSGH
jgi:hypothetical protein